MKPITHRKQIKKNLSNMSTFFLASSFTFRDVAEADATQGVRIRKTQARKRNGRASRQLNCCTKTIRMTLLHSPLGQFEPLQLFYHS